MMLKQLFFLIQFSFIKKFSQLHFITVNSQFFIRTFTNSNSFQDLERIMTMHANGLNGGCLFPHKSVHKYTWFSPDQITANQIDCIAISTKQRGCLLDVRDKRGAAISSDHHVLMGTIRLKIEAVTGESVHRQKKFNSNLLDNPKVFARYVGALG